MSEPGRAALTLLTPDPPEVATRKALDRVFDSWLKELAPVSRKSYLLDLERWAAWRQGIARGTRPSLEQVRGEVEKFIRSGKIEAQGNVGDYLDMLREANCSAATVRHHCSVLRSLVDAYERHGLPWTLKIRLPRGDKRRKRRQTAGPAWAHYQALRAAAAAQWQPKAARDVAILGVVAALRVRVSEVCNLSVEDYRDGRLCLVTKGHRDPVVLEVPPERQGEIDAYLALRGAVPTTAPLFASCDLGSRGSGRLSRGGLYQMVQELARVAGIPGPVSPHRLLHSITTHLLEECKLTEGDVQAWGRWESAETVREYTDSLKRVAAKTAEIASREIGPALLPTEKP